MKKNLTLNENLINEALNRDVRSILMLLNVETKEETLLQEFDYLIEAPQFRTDSEIL